MYRWRQFIFLLVAGAAVAFAIFLLLDLLTFPICTALYWHDRLYDLRMLIWQRNLEWFSAGAGYALVLLKVDWDEIGSTPLFHAPTRRYSE